MYDSGTVMPVDDRRHWMRSLSVVFLVSVVITFTSSNGQSSEQVTYYVKPNTSTNCFTTQPCITLSEFVQNVSSYTNASTNITLMLLPGDHILDQHTRMNVSHLSRFHIIGYRAHRSLSTAIIRILFDKAGTITFSHIGELKVEAIALSACGNPTHRYSILINDVAFVSMTNCTFKDNFSPVKVSFSNLSLEDCTFANNIGVSEGGGIYCNYCNAHFIGYNLFYNNTATSGGGLFAKHSFIIFVGQVHFIKNKARRWGGGIIITEASTLNIKNNTLFFGNSAQTGGGVYVKQESQVLSLCANIELIENTASWGGGIYSDKSNIHFSSSCTARLDHSERLSDSTMEVSYSSSSTHRCITLKYNTATFGGGFASFASVVQFDCDSLFLHNSAHYGGGAMYVLASSSITFNGSNSTFIENSSQYLGGALYIRSFSTITLGCINSAFIANSALYGGGALAVHKGNINLKGREFTFTGNVASYGGALYSYKGHYNVLRGTSIIFRRNSASKGGGALYAHRGNITADLFPFVGSAKGCILFHNNSAFYGGAVAALHSQLSFDQTEYLNNIAYHGGAVYLHFCNFESLQSSLYSNNTAEHGGAVYVRLTNITFYDAVYFSYNTARIGGAISVTEISFLHLNPNTSMHFYQNHAREYGGAIYIQGDSLSCAIPNMKIRRFLFAEHFVANCFVQINNYYCFKKRTNKSSIYEHKLPNVSYQELLMQYEMLPDPGIQIIFQNNIAEVAGNALFGGNIMDCYFNETNFCTAKKQLQIPSPVNPQQFLVFADTSEESDSSIISSYPVQLCLCYEEKKSCSGHPAIKKDIFPGQTFTMSVVAVGQMEGVVPATVHSHFGRNSSAQFRELEDTQTTRKTCTDLHYTVFSRENSEEISVYPEGLCSEYAERFTLSISLLPCPPGFNLSENTSLASCVCEQRLMPYTNSCDITSRTITNRGDSSFWVGYDCDSGLILHPHCPFDFCHSTPVSFTVNSTDLQCNYNRSGLLCGECKTGLSLTLGTSHCIKCSNTYLFLILIFALAGIGLVLLLFICKLTVSIGTINGLIFYANVIGMSKEMFIPPQHSSVLRVFIAWVNLDLGIETCLFDGMDRYVQVWLQFVFPIYLWILVGVIIKVSQHSSRVAWLFGHNPVSVLATLVLLSYAKLLRTILVIFSFTFLEYPDNVRIPVWLYDGNIKYLSGKHIPLFLVALCTLLFLFVPYTLLLLLGQWLQTYSRNRFLFWVNNFRVKAILDAYHGPLSTSHRYWVGLLLVLRCCLFIVFALNAFGNPAVNLLAIAIATFYLAFIKMYINMVYRNWILDIIEASFLINIGTFTVATYYINMAGGNQLALASVSVGTAMVTFVMILLYHGFCQFTGSQVWRNVIRPAVARLRGRWKVQERREVEEEEMELFMNDQPMVAPTTTFISLRESLLDSS